MFEKPSWGIIADIGQYDGIWKFFHDIWFRKRIVIGQHKKNLEFVAIAYEEKLESRKVDVKIIGN